MTTVGKVEDLQSICCCQVLCLLILSFCSCFCACLSSLLCCIDLSSFFSCCFLCTYHRRGSSYYHCRCQNTCKECTFYFPSHNSSFLKFFRDYSTNNCQNEPIFPSFYIKKRIPCGILFYYIYKSVTIIMLSANPWLNCRKNYASIMKSRSFFISACS